MLNKNTCNNRCIYFSSGALGRQQPLLTREFAQGISCLNEHTVTLDHLTLQVSSAPLTLIHDACWDHTTANSLWPTVEGNELYNSPPMHMQSKCLRDYEESYMLIIVVVFVFRDNIGLCAVIRNLILKGLSPKEVHEDMVATLEEAYQNSLCFMLLSGFTVISFHPLPAGHVVDFKAWMFPVNVGKTKIEICGPKVNPYDHLTVNTVLHFYVVGH